MHEENCGGMPLELYVVFIVKVSWSLLQHIGRDTLPYLTRKADNKVKVSDSALKSGRLRGSIRYF